jgi:ElaA protein
VTSELHSATPTELPLSAAYPILKLRVDVFVVEQACAYPELDGRDLEPGALWVWAQDGTAVTATLRLLRDTDGRARIGRVATAPGARSRGVAGALMRHALELIGPDVTTTLDAQSHLSGWYARFGFVPSGPEFIEDGIAHLPMDRPPESAA